MSDREFDAMNDSSGDAMDELAPVFTNDGHVDEGTIHAWLDGAFDESQATTVSTHVDACAKCRAAVAEARGFIAGASRVVRTLDAVPSGVVPQADAARTASRIVAAANLDLESGRVKPAFAPAAASAPAPRRASRPWYARAAFRNAAALVLVVGGASYVWTRAPFTGDDVTVPRLEAPTTDSALPVATMAAETQSVVPSVAQGASESESARAAGRASGAPSATAARERNAPTSAPAAPPPLPAVANVATVSAAETRELRASAESVRDLRQSERAIAAARAKVEDVSKASAAAVAAASTAASPRAFAPAPDMRTTGGVVAGVVVDSGQRPVDRAAVAILGTTIGTVTNARGEFVLRTPRDTATLQVRGIGYESSRVSVRVDGLDTVRANVVLKPSSLSLAAVVVSTPPALVGQTAGMRVSPARTEPGVRRCWEILPLGDDVNAEPGLLLPRAVRAADLTSSGASSSEWLDWPSAGNTTRVEFRRVGTMLAATTATGGVSVSLRLAQGADSWEGTATTVRNGVTRTQRVLMRAISDDVCK